MKIDTTLAEYFRQARVDRSARDHAVMVTRRARSWNGWIAVMFAGLVVFPAAYEYLNHETVSISKVAGLGFLVAGFSFNRFRERLAVFASFEI